MVKYIYHTLKNLFQGYIKDFQYMVKYNYRILKHGVNLFQGYNYIKDFSMYGKIYLPYIEKSFPRL